MDVNQVLEMIGQLEVVNQLPDFVSHAVGFEEWSIADDPKPKLPVKCYDVF